MDSWWLWGGIVLAVPTMVAFFVLRHEDWDWRSPLEVGLESLGVLAAGGAVVVFWPLVVGVGAILGVLWLLGKAAIAVRGARA